MRHTRAEAALLAAIALLLACSRVSDDVTPTDSSGVDTLEAADTSPPQDAHAETAADSPDDSVGALDTQDADADAMVDSAPKCDDPRSPGDGKQAGDLCWSPPTNYCASGCAFGDKKACNAAATVCCRFTCCAPCGWTVCWGEAGEPAACTSVPETTDKLLCQRTAWPGPICWDGVDAGASK
jgi:hypothetical protein